MKDSPWYLDPIRIAAGICLLMIVIGGFWFAGGGMIVGLWIFPHTGKFIINIEAGMVYVLGLCFWWGVPGIVINIIEYIDPWVDPMEVYK